MNESILKFKKVTYGYEEDNPLLKEVDFSILRGKKITLMGQNGAGKSTIFALITKELFPDSGSINIDNNVSVALARQVIPRDQLDLTIKEFFEKCFKEKVYDIDPKIDKVLEVVNLEAEHDRIIKSFSGGQQARILLASALIQDPDLLLLDEPTNNLDKEGIERLKEFLIAYSKTCLVISHDADFLNSFTDGVIYLDVFTKKIEQFIGDYFDVQEQISVHQDKVNKKNVQLSKLIQEKRDRANFFAHKGGKMRILAKRMREKANIAEGEKEELKREDKTIHSFTIPVQEGLSGVIIHITKFKTIRKQKASERKTDIEIRRGEHLLLKGPNGIGKSTLLESIVNGTADGVNISEGTKIGYYRQDFSNLNFDETVYNSLSRSAGEETEQAMRNIAAGFLINGDVMNEKIGDLSEGQKGLISFTKLVLEKPGLLILDEPTNHINFRHIPVIAEALSKYTGAMILVSHVPDFVKKIKIDHTLDLEK